MAEGRVSTPRLLLAEVILPGGFELRKQEAPQWNRESMELLAAVAEGPRVLLVKGLARFQRSKVVIDSP